MDEKHSLIHLKDTVKIIRDFFHVFENTPELFQLEESVRKVRSVLLLIKNIK